jgi:hypothetical protein
VYKVKVKLSVYSPWRPLGLWEIEAPTIFRHSAHRWRQSCRPYAPAAFYPQENSWYSFLLEVFLTSALVGGEWSASCPSRFTPGERAPGTHWIGVWVDPRVGVDDLEMRKFLTLPGLELWPLSRPARSQFLYRLLITRSRIYLTSKVLGCLFSGL